RPPPSGISPLADAEHAGDVRGLRARRRARPRAHARPPRPSGARAHLAGGSRGLTTIQHFHILRNMKTIARLPLAQLSADESHVEAFKALAQDRKSTRLNSSHVAISYAVFCL